MVSDFSAEVFSRTLKGPFSQEVPMFGVVCHVAFRSLWFYQSSVEWAPLSCFFPPIYLFIVIEVKFTEYKIYYFEVYGPPVFSTFMMSGNHHLSLFPKHFVTHKDLVPISSHFPFSSSPSLWKLPICFLFVWIYLLWTFHTNGIVFCVCLPHLASRSIHVVAWVNASFH
jgi:hypothetical protein